MWITARNMHSLQNSSNADADSLRSISCPTWSHGLPLRVCPSSKDLTCQRTDWTMFRLRSYRFFSNLARKFSRFASSMHKSQGPSGVKSAKTYPAQGLELEWPLQNPLEWNDRMSHRFPSQSSEYVEDGGRMQTWECRLNVESSIVATQSKCVLRLRYCEWLGSCFAKRGAFRVSRPLLEYPSAVWIASQQSTWDARQQESSGARISSLSLSMSMSSSFKASSYIRITSDKQPFH